MSSNSCTASRVILGSVSPFMIGFGLLTLLVSIEQFNISSLMVKEDPTEESISTADTKFADIYNNNILTGLMLNAAPEFDHGSPATFNWLSHILANTPMIMLSNLDGNLRPLSTGGGTMPADGVVRGAKLGLLIGACLTLVRALCLLLAGVCAAIFSFCKEKNSTLLNCINTPSSTVVATMLLHTIIQIACSDYVSKLKKGGSNFSLLITLGNTGPEYKHIGFAVYVMLPAIFIVSLVTMLASCCACDPEPEHTDEHDEFLAAYGAQQPQQPQYGQPQQPQYGSYGGQQFVALPAGQDPMTIAPGQVYQQTTTTVVQEPAVGGQGVTHV